MEGLSRRTRQEKGVKVKRRKKEEEEERNERKRRRENVT